MAKRQIGDGGVDGGSMTLPQSGSALRGDIELLAGDNVSFDIYPVQRRIVINAVAGEGGGPHAANHGNGGSDELSVAGLSGLLADAQTPAAHGHSIADTTGLQDALDAKSDVGHTHPGGSGMNLLKKTANQTINAGAGVFTDITDLTFPVVAGTDYAFEFYITFQSAATATGWRAAVNCPAGTLDFWAGSDVIANGAAGVATHAERHNTVRDDMTLLTSTIAQAVDLNVRIKGRYLCTANGTFAARFANELASNTHIVVQKGSWGWWF